MEDTPEILIERDPLQIDSFRSCKVLLTDVKLSDKVKFLTDVTAVVREKRKYTCYVCMSKFPSAKDLDNHKYVHDEESDGEFVSKDSEADSDYSGNESKESESECESEAVEKNPLVCNSDNQKLVNSKSITHKKYRPFSCKTCKLVFKTLCDLRTHIIVSARKVCEFHCKFCTDCFRNSKDFISHIVCYEENLLPARFFKCDVCARSFKNYLEFRKHEIISHNLHPCTERKTVDKSVPEVKLKIEPCGNDLSPDTEKTISISCEICFDIFKTDKEFLTHMKFHRAITPVVRKTEVIVIDDDDDAKKSAPDKIRIPPLSKVAKKVVVRPILPKPVPKPKKSITASKTTVNSEEPKLPESAGAQGQNQIGTIFVKDLVKLKDDGVIEQNNLVATKIFNTQPTLTLQNATPSDTSSSNSGVSIKQMHPSEVSKNRIIVRREFLGAPDEYTVMVQTEKGSVSIKDFLKNSGLDELYSKQLSVVPNALPKSRTPQSRKYILPKTAEPKPSDKSSPSLNIPNTILPAVVQNTEVPKVSTGSTEGNQIVLPSNANTHLVVPNVVTVPPTSNSFINVPLDKQNANSIANSWAAPQNSTLTTNSNLIYVINPVSNLNTQNSVTSEPRMTYINDSSNYTYYIVPPNPAENVAKNQTPQFVAPVVQNTFPMSDRNNVVYTLPTLDPSLNIVGPKSNPQIPTAVLSSDNNLYFITNQSNGSVQGSLQPTRVINTMVTQPSTSVISQNTVAQSNWSGFHIN